MTSLVQDVQYIISLKETLRNPVLPITIIKLIETIHNSIKKANEMNDGKKADWRGINGRNNYSGGRGNSFGGKHHNSSSHSYNNQYKGSRPTRHTNDTIENSTVNKEKSTPTDKHTADTSNIDNYKPHTTRYVSKFKKQSDNVDDTILNNILLGKLNKFSESNYNDIKEFITQIIDNGENTMITCFMKIVFEKAAKEETFCPLYAKLLSELSTPYPVLLDEMKVLYSKYMNIFEEVYEDEAGTYLEMCDRNVEKKYRRGYSQFLAELIKYNVIDADLLLKTINKIITQVTLNSKNNAFIKTNEEYGDCLKKIIKALQPTKGSVVQTVQHMRDILKSDLLQTIKPISKYNSENCGMSMRACFAFLDVYELIEKF